MISCIIQARMGSSRLPGKVMKELHNKIPSLQYTINQLNCSKNVDQIIVATSELSEDNVIEDLVRQNNMCCFRGNAQDVLDRYYQCAKKLKLETIVRITADCPLIDPKIVDSVIDLYQNKKSDYAHNILPRTFPDGEDVEVFSFEALEIAWSNARLPSEREHVTPYFRNNSSHFKINNLMNNVNLSHLRWTLDYEDDLKLIMEIVKRINKRPILLQDILSVLKMEPNLIEINNEHIQDEGYHKSLEIDRKFLNKEL